MSTFSMMRSLPSFLLFFFRGNFTPVISSDRQHKGEGLNEKLEQVREKYRNYAGKKAATVSYTVVLGTLQIL